MFVFPSPNTAEDQIFLGQLIYHVPDCTGIHLTTKEEYSKLKMKQKSPKLNTLPQKTKHQTGQLHFFSGLCILIVTWQHRSYLNIQTELFSKVHTAISVSNYSHIKRIKISF